MTGVNCERKATVHAVSRRNSKNQASKNQISEKTRWLILAGVTAVLILLVVTGVIPVGEGRSMRRVGRVGLTVAAIAAAIFARRGSRLRKAKTPDRSHNADDAE